MSRYTLRPSTPIRNMQFTTPLEAETISQTIQIPMQHERLTLPDIPITIGIPKQMKQDRYNIMHIHKIHCSISPPHRSL